MPIEMIEEFDQGTQIKVIGRCRVNLHQHLNHQPGKPFRLSGYRVA